MIAVHGRKELPENPAAALLLLALARILERRERRERTERQMELELGGAA